MTTELAPVKPPESEILVITGMSGAGRTTAAHALEDHGWYVVENLPPTLLGMLTEIVAHSGDPSRSWPWSWMCAPNHSSRNCGRPWRH